MRQKSQEIYGAHDSDLKEYWDYHEYLAYRRDTQGLSQQEAEYLLQQKENEINARFEARKQAPAAATRSPKRNIDFRCMSECNERGYSYPYCQSKCSY